MGGSCDDGSGTGTGSGAATDTEGSSTASPSSTGSVSTSSGGQLDTTSSPVDPCEDDYQGNDTPQTYHDLQLDTRDAVSIILGDGVAQSVGEVGRDNLVVCWNEPDYFAFEAACDSYVSIEVRKLEGSEDPPELKLYDSTSLATMPPTPIDESTGSFQGFFLRPIQQKIDAGPHVIEVLPLAMGDRAYTLTVTVFPTQNCP